MNVLDYTFIRGLGEGAFGLVKFVTRKSDGLEAACKIIAKPKVEGSTPVQEDQSRQQLGPAAVGHTLHPEERGWDWVPQDLAPQGPHCCQV